MVYSVQWIAACPPEDSGRKRSDRRANGWSIMLATDESITDVAISVGFDDPGYFSKVFRNETGATPREYRSRGMQTDEHVQLLKPE